MRTNNGFTLIEVLLAMVVTLVILAGAYSVFNSQQKQTTIQTNVSDAQQTLRAALDFVSREIRMAGFNPEQSTGNFGIQDIQLRDLDDNPAAAGNSYIQFSWDRNRNGTLDADETMDISLVDGPTITPGTADLYIRFPNSATPQRDVLGSNIVGYGLAYAYDSDGDGDLEEDGAGNTIWAFDANNDNDWDRLVVNQAAGTATITETGTPVDTRTIRAVRIWMLSQSEAPDPNYRDSKTYVVGPHVIVPANNFRHRLLERIILCRNMGLDL